MINDAMFNFFSGLIDGVTIGSVYALIALGLSLVFGITRIYNFAHGSFFTWGAYFAWLVPVVFKREVSYGITFPIVILVMFIFGWVYEKLVVAPIRKSPNWIVTVLITTLAATLVLDTAALVVFGPLTKSLRPLYEGKVTVGKFVINANDLAVLISAAVVISLLTLFLNKTRTGTAMRAVAQDITGANIVGIYVDKIFGYSLGISAVLAGIAGILLAPKYFIDPMGGWVPFVKSFVIVFFGGLGSFKGTICAAIILGIVEAMVGLYISKVWVMPFWFVILIGVLVIRPKGLFGIWG
jgi:branched-chain amino acid transport system permease protein